MGKSLSDGPFAGGMRPSTRPRGNVKGASTSVPDKSLPGRRAATGTVACAPGDAAQAGHSGRRCLGGFIAGAPGAVAAYCPFPKGACINVQRNIDNRPAPSRIRQIHVKWLYPR